MLIYKCGWPEFRNGVYDKEWPSVIAWSRDNLIVFTPGFRNSDNDFPISNDTICLIHPSKPWEVHKTQTGQGIIRMIKWNPTGQQFLTCDNKGVCKIWHPNEYFIDDWKCLNPLDVGEGDAVIDLIWFSDGHHFIDVEKLFTSTKDLLKKFPLMKANLFPNSFNETIEGFIAVTSSGLLKLVLFNKEEEPSINTFKLGSTSVNVLEASIGISGSGKLFIAVQTGRSMVELFTVTFKDLNSPVSLTIDVWPCIIPYMDKLNPEFQNPEIKLLRTAFTGTNDFIITMCRGSNVSSVNIFEIRKQLVTLHPIFPTNQQNSQQNIDTPLCIKSIPFQKDIKDIIVTKSKFSNSGKNNFLSQKMIVFETSGILHIYSLNDWSHIAISNLYDTMAGCKSISLSPYDHALFAVDKYNEMLLYSLPLLLINQDRFTNNQEKVAFISNLLQLAIVEEKLPWDLVLAMRSLDDASIENVIQLFAQDFHDQTLHLQNMSYSIFSKITSLIYQILRNGHGIIETNYAVTFHELYTFISVNSSGEKDLNFLEVVQKCCTSLRKEADISKIIQKIDLTELNCSFFVDATHKSFIQWVFDYTIHVIRMLLSSHHNQSWKNKLKLYDTVIFSRVREFLLMFYILYQKNIGLVHLHPIFQCMISSTDVTVQLFKLYTKLYLISSGDNSIELSLHDLPFNNLPLMYFQHPTNPRQENVLTQLHQVKNGKFQDFVVQPKQDDWNYIQQTSVQNPLVCGISTVNTSFRQIYDGINLVPTSLMNGELVKKCCDCGCLSVYSAHPSRVFIALWKDLFQETCICGGFWRKVEWKADQ